MGADQRSREELLLEIQQLRGRLQESEELVDAIRNGAVDAIIVSHPTEKVYTLRGADYSYRILIEAMSEGALVLSSDGMITYCNGRFAEMMKTSAQHLTGSSLFDFMRPEESGDFGRMLQQGMAGSIKGEIEMRAWDGSLVPAHVSISPVAMEGLEGACAVITDLTEQKEVQEELRRHRTELERMVDERTADLARANTELRQEIIDRKQAEHALRQSETRYRILHESLRDAFVQVTMDGRVIECNDVFCRMLGYSPQEIRRLTYQQLTPERWHGFEERVVREQILPRGYSDVYEKEYRRKDGTTFPVELRTILSRDVSGGPTSMWAIVRDITERKQLEETLRKSRDELEIRVEERTAELRVTNRALTEYSAKLERLTEELQEFAFVASHDLQEPLRKIQTFGNMLGSSFNDILGETGRDYLMRMTKSANRMSELIQSLLNYSRIATRPNPFEPTDLAKAVEDAVSDLDLVIKRVQGEVQIGDMPLIDADPVQIRQLFQNLIGNSMKYSSDSEKPTVRIYGQAAGGMCRIFVEDNGIGFEERYLDRIFKPFQRLHGRSTQYEGTGMGLAICRKIVERHGGSITAKSTPGEGTTFIINLPIKQSAGA